MWKLSQKPAQPKVETQNPRKSPHPYRSTQLSKQPMFRATTVGWLKQQTQHRMTWKSSICFSSARAVRQTPPAHRLVSLEADGGWPDGYWRCHVRGKEITAVKDSQGFFERDVSLLCCVHIFWGSQIHEGGETSKFFHRLPQQNNVWPILFWVNFWEKNLAFCFFSLWVHFSEAGYIFRKLMQDMYAALRDVS